MKKNKKTLYGRFILGLKLAWNTSLLAKIVLAFHNYPFVRIIRVLGGLCVLVVLLQKHFLQFLPLQYLVLFLAQT